MNGRNVDSALGQLNAVDETVVVNATVTVAANNDSIVGVVVLVRVARRRYDQFERVLFGVTLCCARVVTRLATAEHKVRSMTCQLRWKIRELLKLFGEFDSSKKVWSNLWNHLEIIHRFCKIPRRF